MKNIIIPFFACQIFLTFCYAQNYHEVIENKPLSIEGVEYSYIITNESMVKDFNRFEITIMATNNSGCQLIYINQNKILSLFEGDP